jgi:hypothetical protein
MILTTPTMIMMTKIWKMRMMEMMMFGLALRKMMEAKLMMKTLVGK